ncbi:hypothetical protein KP509_28G055400 [Ceratopteris richardii]|uniref:L-2-hydroxyglutarate dehydrogenase, mitochondrial n=1 Tax=Ceratopteris richardii TaxID=49495 RepID=A0A8T2RCF2_CERRI|nr:hypothetical protein KP509_28G055400 [Ceratopteris richardii]
MVANRVVKRIISGHFHASLTPLKNGKLGGTRLMSAPAGKRAAGVVDGTNDEKFDVAIIGGGIVGLATAREIVNRFSNARVIVVEKEKNLVPHQTSHNSGVIHAGIYYEPGSDMAYLCVEGARRLYEYCEKKGLPCKRVGKLIVATREEELTVLQYYYERAKANKVQGLEILRPDQIRDLEPNIQALQALHSPNTGITDYAQVGLSYSKDFLASGRGKIHSGFEVIAIEGDEKRGIEIYGKGSKMVKSRWLITCAGLQSDYVGYMAGGKKGPTVLPFRGTYHELKPEVRNIITRNIYPVPDPKFPMVGVHLTPRVDGSVLIGPNAALSLAKEGYRFRDFNLKDSLKFASNKGLWKLVLRNPGIVLQEVWRDINTKAFVREAQRYCPTLKLDDTAYGWSGVHAVAIDDDGKIIGDFLFEVGKAGLVLNVRNAPSPACTASLAIATAIVDQAVNTFDWKNWRHSTVV